MHPIPASLRFRSEAANRRLHRDSTLRLGARDAEELRHIEAAVTALKKRGFRPRQADAQNLRHRLLEIGIAAFQTEFCTPCLGQDWRGIPLPPLPRASMRAIHNSCGSPLSLALSHANDTSHALAAGIIVGCRPVWVGHQATGSISRAIARNDCKRRHLPRRFAVRGSRRANYGATHPHSAKAPSKVL
jgi:hypothetical protein